VGWPTFDTVTFDVANDPGVAELARESSHIAFLATEGVPKSVMGLCEADPALTVIPSHRRWISGMGTDETSQAGGPLIRFGSERHGGAIALDPFTGEVVEVSDVEGRFGSPFARLMNGSLAHLRATARAVIDRFPYYDAPQSFPQSDEWLAQTQLAQNDLLRLIEEADPRAFDEGGGWTEFPWDVGMGDWYTQAVIDD
jgi:hypothetical protein